MEIFWELQRRDSVPPGDDWLGPQERAAQERFHLPQRQGEWRLGRYAAKRLLAELVGVQAIDRIQVIAAEDGAPEAIVDGYPLDVSISITHRSGLAACALVRGSRVGCDLEAIEPRTGRFVVEYFTNEEQSAVARTPTSFRDRHVALIWSAKESALKVLRMGLRRDTRSVDVEIENPRAMGNQWSVLEVAVSPEQQTFGGWWRQIEDSVLTVACDDPTLRIARRDDER